jgi:hypothetical protein
VSRGWESTFKVLYVVIGTASPVVRVTAQHFGRGMSSSWSSSGDGPESPVRCRHINSVGRYYRIGPVQPSP